MRTLNRRLCRLSTGDMPEVIEEVRANRYLRFRVLKTPASMRELNPFGEVNSPHLHGYYTSKKGEFRLTPLPGGRTLLEGSSRYECRIYPAIYWNLWTDTIVDRVHLSVMQEIRRRAERPE